MTWMTAPMPSWERSVPWNIREARVGTLSAVLDLGMWWWIDWRTTSTTLAILKNNAPPLPIICFRFVSLWLHIPWYRRTASSLLRSLPVISMSTYAVMRFLYVPYITANHFWSFSCIFIFLHWIELSFNFFSARRKVLVRSDIKLSDLYVGCSFKWLHLELLPF